MAHRGRKPFAACAFALLAASLILSKWRDAAEITAYFAPDIPETDLAPYFESEVPNYEMLLWQTGLGRAAIDTLWDQPDGKEKIKSAQRNFFTVPKYRCEPNTPVSSEEHALAPVTELVDLQDGDILITPCSHTFGWRNGHAAIVIDAASGKTLESVVLGEPARIQSVDKWVSFPQFAVMRVRGADTETKRAAANWAEAHLLDVPYRFDVGILSPKYPIDTEIVGTQCAHLVWLAYASQGIDIDGNKGKIVTPHDILKSDALEIVQVYGMDMNTLTQSS